MISGQDLATATCNQAVVLPKWRKSIANYFAGGAAPRIAILSDSTGRGLSPGAAASTKQYQNSIGAFLAKLLTAQGLPTRDDNLFGCGVITGATIAEFEARDDRMSHTGSPSIRTDIIPLSMGSYMFQVAPGDTIKWAPAGSFDTVKLTYLQNTSGAGSATVNVDGGASLGTVNSSGARSMQSVTYTVTAGTHTLNIVGATGLFQFMGAEFSSSTAIKVQIINISAASLRTNLINYPTSQPWDYLAALATVADPDLTIIDLMINEVSDGTIDPSVWGSNLQALGGAAVAAGSDVVLKTPNPASTWDAGVQLSLYQALRAKLFEVAAANKWQVQDTTSRLVDKATTAALGFYSVSDQVHLNAPGYVDVVRPAVSMIWNNL
jgi:lysophospholipase L1-like esterase